MDHSPIDHSLHVAKYKKYYDSGVLQPEYHARLVQNIEVVAEAANIQVRHILNKMSDFQCTQEEIECLRGLKKCSDIGMAGMVYIGKASCVEDRMMAVVGACVRNYIDARVFTVQEVISRLKDGNMPQSRVIAVPNFALSHTEGGNLPSWQTSSLLGWLYSRYSRGLFTVLYVQSLSELANSYGRPFKEHIAKHYKPIA